MRRVPQRLAGVLLAITTLITGCIKPNTLDPYANPGRHELDRLQKIVNERPDLETVEDQLANLDATIQAAITRYSPQTEFATAPYSHPTNGCNNPFNRTIGRQEKSDLFFGRPAPTPEQWLQIVSELAPVFRAAGFKTEMEYAASQGVTPPPGSQNDSQIRDDGTRINLVGGGTDGPLDYSYDTGCHLPAAWRTAPPPETMRPANDSNVHYPYLYGSPGGRNVDAN